MLLGLVSILFALAQAPDTTTTSGPVVLSLEKALEIALSENVSVKVADREIERAQYARKGSYASLFPQVDGSASFQRTIEKQVMYMDFDMSSIMGGIGGGLPGGGEGEGGEGGITPPAGSGGKSSNDGMEVGRWNTFATGVSASMPLVNFQLWESLRISGQDVELAVEKARNSRLEMVTQVKAAFYGVLLAKESYKVYKEVFDNATLNYERTKLRREAQKASELELARAATSLANAVPNMYDSQNAVALSLWQLKAVMGVDLDMDIDVEGELFDYADDMFDLYSDDDLSLDNNSTMRQLELQAEQLASAVKTQQYAYLPSLAVAFTYNYNAMANDFKFDQYRWTPYSYVGLSLNIPIFSGGKRLNNVRAAKVQASELELQKANTERQLKISIRKNLNTMETAVHSHDAADKALEAAQKAYDITEESYAVGSSTITDLNDAQLALVQAKMAVCQSIYSYLSAKASLEQTLGYDFQE